MVPSKSQTKAAVKKKIDGSDDAARFNLTTSAVWKYRVVSGARLCRYKSSLDYWSKAVWSIPHHELLL